MMMNSSTTFLLVAIVSFKFKLNLLVYICIIFTNGINLNALCRVRINSEFIITQSFISHYTSTYLYCYCCIVSNNCKMLLLHKYKFRLHRLTCMSMKYILIYIFMYLITL